MKIIIQVFAFRLTGETRPNLKQCAAKLKKSCYCYVPSNKLDIITVLLSLFPSNAVAPQSGHFRHLVQQWGERRIHGAVEELWNAEVV